MTRDWSQLKKPQSGTKSDREIERLRITKDETRVRFIGDVLPRYVYWVTTKEGARRPIECLSFDRETESFNKSEGVDPMLELPEAVYDDKPGFSYVTNVIDRSDGKIKLMDLKLTIYKQLIDFATSPEYGSPSDPDEGYDINIKREKTGPLPQNVKYTVMPSRKTVPLTALERDEEPFSLDTLFKRPTYDEQKKWLLDNTAYFDEEIAGDLNSTEDMMDLE